METMNNKLAFPWLCWLCGGQYRGESDTAHHGAWGRLCWPCWMLGAESEEEKDTRLELEHNNIA